MTSTKFNEQPPERSRLRDALLSLLVIVVVAVIGYLAYRLLSIHEEEIIIEEVSTIRDGGIDFNTPKPSQDDILNWMVSSDHPRFLSIAAIGLGKTRVETVGRNPQDAVDIPVNIWNAAWFNESALPGVTGTGLYDCHTFFGVGTGVCDNLKYLKYGDEIVIERGDGIKYTYSTVEVKNMTVGEANSYMNTLMSVPDGYGATQSISIITCAGNFNMSTQTSDRRLTIRAILVR